MKIIYYIIKEQILAALSFVQPEILIPAQTEHGWAILRFSEHGGHFPKETNFLYKIYFLLYN